MLQKHQKEKERAKSVRQSIEQERQSNFIQKRDSLEGTKEEAMRELWYAFDALGEEETDDAKKKKQLQKLISGHVIQRADYLAQVLFVWLV
jgi:hypothetical protein